MLHTNIPIIFSKKEIPTIRKQVEKNIDYGLQELKQYINAKEKIDIKYDIQEVRNGYICTGDLYLGKNLVKHYDYIDELFLDLYQMELKILIDSREEYNGLALFGREGEPPFVVSISTNTDKSKVEENLINIKARYKDTEITVISTWIENISKNDIYKKVCENYVKTMLSQAILEKPNNNSILHIFLTDEAIELNQEGKITIDNYNKYLMNEGSINEYKNYEDFYKCFVKDFIVQDVIDLGLFNGKDNKWDFYISYNDMKKLGLEDIVNKQIEEEFGTTYIKENNNEEEEEL